MTREDVISRNPILPTLQQMYGMEFKKLGGEYYALCKFHAERKPSLRVNPDKGTWFCDPCGTGGSIIDFVMKHENVDFKQAMEKLGASNGHPQEKEKIKAIYPYLDEHGKQLYQVVRFEPKTFRQRHGSEGNWVWKMDGVRRVLFQLPEVLKANRVCLCEGEKDALNVSRHGYVGTCNVGGAGKWLDAYTETLKGKEVVILPDNDEAGRKHAELVIKSLEGKAKAIFLAKIPDPFKDISDYMVKHADESKVKLVEVIEAAQKVEPLLNLPLKSMKELHQNYRAFVARVEKSTLNLGKWLPSLGTIRHMVPGELMVVLADTGQGKTALLQNLALAAHPLPTILFEIELPETLIFERFLQIEGGMDGDQVETAYKKNLDVGWEQRGRLNHIYTCAESKLNPPEIERIITNAELKIGAKPALVIVDYIGLVAGKGGSRYERISDAAEQMKVIAKTTNTIFAIGSQVTRGKGDKDGELFLHDAKESGSIENSAGLVLGAWRCDDGNTMKIKILKNTKGKAGRIIECDFKGDWLRVSQKQISSQETINYQTHPDPR